MSKTFSAGGAARLLATMLVAASLVLACAPMAQAAIQWGKEDSDNVPLTPQWTDLAYQWELYSCDEQLSDSVSRVHTKMTARNYCGSKKLDRR